MLRQSDALSLTYFDELHAHAFTDQAWITERRSSGLGGEPVHAMDNDGVSVANEAQQFGQIVAGVGPDRWPCVSEILSTAWPNKGVRQVPVDEKSV